MVNYNRGVKKVMKLLDKEMNIHASKVLVWLKDNFEVSEELEEDFKDKFFI